MGRAASQKVGAKGKGKALSRKEKVGASEWIRIEGNGVKDVAWSIW